MLNDNNEIWKQVVGFEEFYEVSNKGQIRSFRTKRILKTYLINSGYKSIKFTVNNRRTSHLIHRLVATAFIPNEDELANQVNHINGDKLDNSVDNLEWVTCSSNLKHAFEIGLRTKESCKTYVGLKHKNPLSKYHNVSYDKSRSKWVAKVTHNGKNHFQKRFYNEIEAALHVNWIIDKLGLQEERPKNIIN